MASHLLLPRCKSSFIGEYILQNVIFYRKGIAFLKGLIAKPFRKEKKTIICFMSRHESKLCRESKSLEGGLKVSSIYCMLSDLVWITPSRHRENTCRHSNSLIFTYIYFYNFIYAYVLISINAQHTLKSSFTEASIYMFAFVTKRFHRLHPRPHL